MILINYYICIKYPTLMITFVSTIHPPLIQFIPILAIRFIPFFGMKLNYHAFSHNYYWTFCTSTIVLLWFPISLPYIHLLYFSTKHYILFKLLFSFALSRHFDDKTITTLRCWHFIANTYGYLSTYHMKSTLQISFNISSLHL